MTEAITLEIMSDNEERQFIEANDKGTWIKFRYTFPDPEEWNGEKVQKMVRYMQYLMLPKYMSWGVEALDKCGLPTKPHLHIMAYTEKKTSAADPHAGRIGAIRKKFTERESEDNDYYKSAPYKGNKLYSMEHEVDCKDPYRVLRYCWKQGGEGLPLNLKGLLSHRFESYRKTLPDGMDINLELKAGREEWAHGCEAHLKAKKRNEEPTSCDKLIAHLEALENKPLTARAAMIEMLKYYTEREQPAQKHRLQGYVVIYLLKNKVVSFEEMADNFLLGM